VGKKNLLITLLACVLSLISHQAKALDAPAGLVPSGLNPGDKFYIIFVTSFSGGPPDGSSANISVYNSWVQSKAASSTVSGIQTLSNQFLAVGATATDDQCKPFLDGASQDLTKPVYTVASGTPTRVASAASSLYSAQTVPLLTQIRNESGAGADGGWTNTGCTYQGPSASNKLGAASVWSGYSGGTGTTAWVDNGAAGGRLSGRGYFAVSPLLTVPGTPISLTPSSQTVNGTVGIPITATTAFTQTGLTGTVSYSVSPALPSSLSINSSTGVISGTPASAQSSVNYTVTATGSTSGSATATVSISVNAVVPGAPTIGTATAGNAQASVTFTAPANNGGALITGYTVTSNPGGLTGTGASSPITVTGLTNGTAYTFTVTATNSAGTGSASAASNSVTPTSAVNGACGTANGVASALKPSANLCSAGTASSVASASPWTWSCAGSGGGTTASCSAPNSTAGSGTARVGDASNSSGAAAWQVQSAAFSNTPPATPPAGVTLPNGVLALNLNSGTPGSSTQVTITYSQPLPAGAKYWKYGKERVGDADHWYVYPNAVISGNTVTLTLTDGALGDNDLAANGLIADPGGVGVGGDATAIPTLSEWAMMLLSGLLGLFGFLAYRRTR